MHSIKCFVVVVESVNVWSGIYWPIQHVYYYNVVLIFFACFSAIGRNLIPRYFRSIFEGGVKELYYHIVQPKESFHNNTSTITLDCENTTMVTHHKSPVFTKVCKFYLIIFSLVMSCLMLTHALFEKSREPTNQTHL